MNATELKALNKEIKKLRIEHIIPHTVELYKIYQKYDVLGDYPLDGIIEEFDMPVELNNKDISYIKKSVIKEIKEKYNEIILEEKPIIISGPPYNADVEIIEELEPMEQVKENKEL